MIDYVSKLFLFVIRCNMNFYAVGRGRKTGVFSSWQECNKYVQNFKGAKFKKFSTEGEAWDFVKKFNNDTSTSLNDSVLVGQKVTSEEPKSLLSELCLKVQALEQKQGKAIHDINEIKCYLQSLESGTKKILDNSSDTFSNDNALQEGIKKLDMMEKEYEYYSTEFGKIKEYMKKDNEPELGYNCSSSSCSKESTSITSLNRVQVLSTCNLLGKRKFSSSSDICGGNEHKRMKCTNFNISPKTGFITNEDGFVEVYTDGACENNGKFGAKAGIGVWFGENHSLNISEPVKGRATNNMAEIQAASEAVNAAKRAGIKKLLIHTDSKFLIDCMTKWISKWKKCNWHLSNGQPVKNKQELIVLDNAIKGMEIKWNHVRGHCGILGNERADELARNGAEQYIKV